MKYLRKIFVTTRFSTYFQNVEYVSKRWISPKCLRWSAVTKMFARNVSRFGKRLSVIAPFAGNLPSWTRSILLWVIKIEFAI